MFSVFRNKVLFLPVIFFVVLSLWWVYIMSLGMESTEHVRQIWAALYQGVAIMGGIIGVFSIFHWSGYKSLLGRIILAFSIGLFLQSFGQSAYSYYIFFKQVEVPYPSMGDIGFFGSIIAYIYAVVVLAKFVGVKFSFEITASKVRGLIISFVILLASYFFFLQGYEFDWSNKLRIFLDFGYPLGQAVYLSIAISAFLVARDFLGGMLRKPILFLLFALVFQYGSDFMFLYQYNNGTWYVGGINDFLYFSSYFLMTVALVYLDYIFSQIKSEESNILDSGSKEYLGASTSTILNQIILAIIKKQEKVAGAIAWEEAKEIPGLRIVDQKEEKFVVTGDAKEVVNRLVDKYKALFGDLAVQVSKDAARHLLATLPRSEVPEILK